MTTTPLYNDPILTADDINLAAYMESMQRFQQASQSHDYAMADSALDHRYDVITDDRLSASALPLEKHPDTNFTGKWPFQNPYHH